MTQSLRVQRRRRLATSRDRPDFGHGRRVPDTAAPNHIADIPRTADIALQQVDARRVYDEVGKLARGQRADGAVDAERVRCVRSGSAQDLEGTHASCQNQVLVLTVTGSHLVVRQTARFGEEHLGVVVDTKRWLAVRADVGLETLPNHLSRGDGRVEDLVRWMAFKVSAC